MPNQVKQNDELIDYKIISWHFYAGIFYIFVAILAGLSYSLQFLQKYPFPGVSFLSPGRIRIVHTNAVAFGWLINGLVAVLYYIIPKLTERPVLSKKLSYLVFWVYNTLVIGCVVGYLTGHAQGIEWGETPAILDPFISLGVVLLVINLLTPIFKIRAQKMYVSLWYASAALIWTPLVYVMGNFLPQYVYPGTSGATITSMYIHDLVGLSVTPLGIAATYYLLPVVMKRPIYSHALSIIGFWGLAFFYPLNSAHHYLFSPIPMWTQYASIVASIGVHVVVYTVVFNIIATVASDWKQLTDNIPLRWIFFGTIAYLITCIQCAIQVTLSAQSIIHFTDWVVGHAHFVLFGTFSFWVTAWVYYLLPRIWGVPLYSLSLARWHFWLSAIGISIMQIDLLSAGVVQGMMWKSLVPFIDSVVASIPFWWTRTFSGIMILTGECLFLVNLYATWQESKRGPVGNLQPQPA
jgi:cytochrome c oxidase cbb3-type subunit I